MQSEEFTTLWRQYIPFIEAVTELLHPFVEVAVHDLEQGKLAGIYHSLSRRKVGETSPLHELKIPTKDFPDRFASYYKENWDGRPLKCTSITLRSKKGNPIGLICINVDVSAFQEGFQLLKAFLETKTEAKNPVEIFGAQCEEQSQIVIQEYLEAHHLSLNHLDREQKQQLVHQLYKKGIFNFKNAAPFIAKKLKTSRASIYNYIRKLED